MNLHCCNEIEDSEELLHLSCDLLICSCGYEKRSTAFSEAYTGIASSKIAIEFGDRKELSRYRNEDFFKNNEFKMVELEGDDYSFVKLLLHNETLHLQKPAIDVIIDYSCMTKSMYASVINYFRYSSVTYNNVNLYFVYSPGKYHESHEAKSNVVVSPITGFTSIMPPNFPTALILGLGCEKGRAFSLREYVDPEVTYLLFSDPVKEPKFLDDIYKANSDILKDTNPKFVFTYPLTDFRRTSLTLSSVLSSLKETHRVILAPLGPKPFSLACMIQAIIHSDVDVWRVSGGSISTPVDISSDGSFISTRVQFIS